MQRRDFLRLSTSTGIGIGLGMPAFADEAQTPESLYARFVPHDKELAPDWVASLTRREHPLAAGIRHSNQEVDLEHIGMTVGGLCCGTVYLSGDGRLWVWDIFNQHHEGVVPNKKAKAPEGLGNIQGRNPMERDGANFLLPPRASEHQNGIDHHVTLIHEGQSFRMDQNGWDQVTFDGRWPLASICYASKKTMLKAALQAYTPFIPLNFKDSSLPVTVMEYTIENTGGDPVTCALQAHLNNAAGQFSGRQSMRQSNAVRTKGRAGLFHFLKQARETRQAREDRVLFDFESGGYQGWQVEGDAFGTAPASTDQVPDYQGDLHAKGGKLINSHVSATGNVSERDAKTGKLTSPSFTIDRKFLAFLIGGGRSPETLCVKVMVDGKTVASSTGHNANAMRQECFDLSAHQGKQAVLVIEDRATAGWGNIGADQFVLTDVATSQAVFGSELDYGSMELAALTESAQVDVEKNTVTVPLAIPARGSVTVKFVIAWHFPNLNGATGIGNVKRHYARDFTDAKAVVDHFAGHQERLCSDTKTWVATWNDSTLPQWLLDRSVLTSNTLQTQNCLMFDNGRFWAWEGIGCCQGTCGHVWEYSQGHARLFPELERNLREITDYKIGLNKDGSIRFRGSNNALVAIDSQCGYILRTLRDWQLSDDPGFLKRVWEAAKKAIGYLVEFDRRDPRGGLDGLLDGMQHNTLDAEWYGKVHVLCSMYLAALRAGEELAKAMQDQATASQLRTIHEMGSRNIEKLFNGEYFEQIEDPAHSQAIGVGKGCYIDQVMGQFWANQVGLGRIYNAEQQKSALRALWKYNFVPDYGSFRQGFREGRHYATKGDSGLLMCTWPKGGLRDDFKKHWQYGYFNEFMTGFEYEVAAHMVAEGDEDLVTKGLAITRAIHDRYSAKRGRNPYNEIECSDHYARAGASYGVFLAVCGFEFDQSKGLLGFNPVIQKEHFRAPFTTSEAWGTYEQKGDHASVTITHGTLRLREIRLGFLKGRKAKLTVDGIPVNPDEVTLEAGKKLEISV